ncbi:MAG TPA: FtsQ-type POTRA domain-containing protein [Adlercreutzia equolifaciens]|uniref:cell division protein FtsQ/DivIB n=1 Tax=Adlercreutzia equolifaciens TaxID=446660 RepID=UPI0024325E21|nr:FtsQ-type POTRA domain-containing protein [Adlercreutzia equolifaciens]HJI11515.1 FtsQ-type POTRA domain-containing protein [Adlercreutzia equolifaciens]
MARRSSNRNVSVPRGSTSRGSARGGVSRSASPSRRPASAPMRPASSRPAPSVRPTSRAHFGSAASSAAGRSAGGRASGARPAPRTVTTSVRLGDLPASRGDRRAPAARAIARPKRSGAFKAFIVALVLVCVLGITYAALYFSGAFAITSVKVNGADHLTNDEMAILAAVPQGTTLLNVDTSSVANSVDRDAWVADVSVNRIFPDTLEINVTEREIAAIVEVAADNAKVTQMWAIASDGMWLMEIPARDSELGATISPQIYEDADRVLHITGVPFGLTPEVGTYCADGNVNNALAILDGLSTELAEQVKTVTATGAASTCLTLDNGIEIAFGTAEDIRDKERIVLQIMADNPGKVSYINVRVPDRPTWRAV